MTESEGTTQGSSPSAGGGSSSTGRKRTTRARRTTGKRRKSTSSGKKSSARRTASRRSPSRRRRPSKQAGLETLLNDLAKRANRAGSTIATLSEGGANAARRALGKATATSRQTITRVKREWDKMDNTRKLQFAGALLGALAAAAAAGVRKASKK